MNIPRGTARDHIAEIVLIETSRAQRVAYEIHMGGACIGRVHDMAVAAQVCHEINSAPMLEAA